MESRTDKNVFERDKRVNVLPMCTINYWNKQFKGLVKPTSFHILNTKQPAFPKGMH